MAYHYDLLPEARLELFNILDYYEQINPNLKTEFLHEYIELVDRMCDNPEQFSPHWEFYRKARFTKTFKKYHMVFKVYPEIVLIVAVAHDRRKQYYWKDRG